MTPALRALVWFWAGMAVLAGGAVAVLRFVGPSSPPTRNVTAPPASLPGAAAMAAQLPPTLRHTGAPLRHGAIAVPDPALEEPAPGYDGSMLPRVGADGRTPMRTYAAAAVPDEHRPRVAMLLTGIGMSPSEDEAAVDVLPSAVSFALSPYAYRPDAMLQKMRDRGHESFLSLPMEPQGFPTDDPGAEALLTGNVDGVNQQRLQWAMSRFAGYVGTTSVMGALRGERFAANSAQMAPVLRELGSRGLMYVDGRLGAVLAPGAVGRSVDAVVEPRSADSEIDVTLARLEAKAHDNGSAIGVAGPPRPILVARLANWAAALAARGLDLVPVSAVVSAEPPTAEAAAVQP